MAFDGQWRPLFEYIALAYKENSAIRDAIEGEHNLQGFFKAYLALASYYLVQPELEMNYGYCDFSSCRTNPATRTRHTVIFWN